MPTPAKAQTPSLSAALATFLALRDHVGGCLDGSCVVKPPTGMHTNGGCRCGREPMKAQRMMLAGQQLAAAVAAHLDAPPMSAEDAAVEAFLDEVRAELKSARTKFPGDRIMTIAMTEEVGELAKAILEEPAARVRREAVQTATMAARIVLDGDGSVIEWRAQRGLDPLVPVRPHSEP